MEDMREFLHYFFQDVQQVKNVPEPEEESAEEQDAYQGNQITQ